MSGRLTQQAAATEAPRWRRFASAPERLERIIGVPYELQPVRLNDGGDQDGLLVFIDGDLTGVLSKLGPGHGERAGRWNIEYAFGLNLPGEKVFQNAEEAGAYLEKLRTAKR